MVGVGTRIVLCVFASGPIGLRIVGAKVVLVLQMLMACLLPA